MVSSSSARSTALAAPGAWWDSTLESRSRSSTRGACGRPRGGCGGRRPACPAGPAAPRPPPPGRSRGSWSRACAARGRRRPRSRAGLRRTLHLAGHGVEGGGQLGDLVAAPRSGTGWCRSARGRWRSGGLRDGLQGAGDGAREPPGRRRWRRGGHRAGQGQPGGQLGPGGGEAALRDGQHQPQGEACGRPVPGGRAALPGARWAGRPAAPAWPAGAAESAGSGRGAGPAGRGRRPAGSLAGPP